ncbi:hypothetical protein DLM_3625 [Aquitalea magnusonii]|uniref:Uncharacterized protein n=1 Tax=Aquitalea magnusonii TaxID=332411 RepID=A0A3G9GMM2_9NEIS|nr:hypothetical protein DLM_3625 [Aquitalea magnusonii]
MLSRETHFCNMGMPCYSQKQAWTLRRNDKQQPLAQQLRY